MGLHKSALVRSPIRGRGSGPKIGSGDSGDTDEGGHRAELETWGAPQTFGAEGRRWATAHPVGILETGGLQPYGNYQGT